MATMKVRVKSKGSRCPNPSSGGYLPGGNRTHKRDPDGKLIFMYDEVKTVEVPRSPYWIRRVRDGSVILVEDDSPSPKPPEPKPSETPGNNPVSTKKKTSKKTTK